MATFLTLITAFYIALVSCDTRAYMTAPHRSNDGTSGERFVTAGATRLPEPRVAKIKGSYFYDYMSLDHLDSLAAAGFNRAIVKFIADSLGKSGTVRLGAWMGRGTRVGIDVTPSWALQAKQRLNALKTTRRYTWGRGTVEQNVGCPLDSLFWKSAFFDRAEEILANAPGARRLAPDLEIYTGSRHHYDAGPCKCNGCLREFRMARGLSAGPGSDDALAAFEEDQLTRMLGRYLVRFAAAHPGIEIGVFDLDLDSFVHRAMAKALSSAGVPTVDYTERTYRAGSSGLSAARAALDAVNRDAPIVGGLWLGKFTPAQLPEVTASILDASGGYFIFTTYSLWQEPAKLTSAYALAGSRSSYWAAFRTANR